MSNRELEEREVHQRHQHRINHKYNDDNHIDNRFNDDDDERVVPNNNNINDNNAYTMNELQEKVDRLEKINNDLDNKKQNKNKIYSGDVVAVDIPSGEVEDVELGTTKKQNDDQFRTAAASAPSSGQSQVETTTSATTKLPFNYNLFLQRVFSLMFIGLCVTAGVSFLCQLYKVDVFLAQHSGLFIGLLIFEIVLVFYLIYAFAKFSYQTAAGVFFFYALLNGVTITPMVTSYTAASVALAFICTSSIFLSMAAIGYFTKHDLTSWGPILFSALVGLIVATVVNIFLQSSTMQFVICVIGVLIFSGLTAYDVNILKRLGEQMGNKSETDDMMKLAVFGALQLYLDFLNLFLYILQLLGKARN